MARFVRDEKRTYPFTWLFIGGLFAASSVWAVQDEFTHRVEWHPDQTAFFDLEFEMASQELKQAAADYEVASQKEPLKKQIADLAALEASLKTGEYFAANTKLDELKAALAKAEQANTFGASDLDEAYYYRNLAEYERDAKTVAVRNALKAAYPEDAQRARSDGDALYGDPQAPARGDMTAAMHHLHSEVARMNAHIEKIEEARKTARSAALRTALQASGAAEQVVANKVKLEIKHQAKVDTAVAAMSVIVGPSDPPVADAAAGKLHEAKQAARTKACAEHADTINCVTWLRLGPTDREIKLLTITVSKARRRLVDAELRYNEANLAANPPFDPSNLIKTLVGPLQIRQIVTHWMKYERDIDIEQVDRCPTCHMGVDSNYYTAPSVPPQFRTHPRRELLMASHPIEKFGCTVCHQGQGRATDNFAHSGWELEDYHGHERWHYAGDHYWEDPLLPPGHLEAIVVDGLNDELSVKFGKKKGTVKLDHGTLQTEGELLAALQSKLQTVLDTNKNLATSWKAVTRRLDGRVSIGLEKRAGAKSDSKAPRVEIGFTKSGLATLLGFHGTRLLKSRTTQLYTASRPLVQPVRAENAVAQGSLVNTATDYAYVPPRGDGGLQVPDTQRDHFIQALPEIESSCLRCHLGDADLVPRRSDSKAIRAKLAYEKAEVERGKDPQAYRAAHGTDALPKTEQGSRDVESLAPTLDQGRQVFRQLNCNGCHLLEGFAGNKNAGPQLDDLSSKVTPQWLLTWLRDPRGWRAKTSMPNLWPRPLDPASKLPYEPGSPEYAAWDKERSQQTIAIAAYLFEKSDAKSATGDAKGTPLRETVAGYADVDGASAEDGKNLFAAYGCQGCHANTNGGADLPEAWRARERDIAPTLSNLGAKTNADWIAYWIENPSRYWHGTSMPTLRLNRKEAASIAKYLVGLNAPPPAAAKVTKAEVARIADPAKRQEMVACQVAGGQQMSLVDCGAKAVAYRGCYGCHQMDGFDGVSLIGPELTGFAKKDVSTLDFGYAISDHHLQTTETFATLKLDSPRVYSRDRIELRMGDYDMSAAEIRALVVFLKGMVPSTPAEDFDPMEKPAHAAVIAGRQLVDDLNCRACHVIEGRGGDIDGWRKALITRDPQLRAPWLDGEGARVQPEWLFSFFRDPQKHGIRPWLHPEWVWGDEVPTNKRALRMPTFDLTAEQWTSIVRYFSSWDGEAYPYQVPQVATLNKEQKLFSLTHMNSPQAGNCLSCHYHGDFPVKRAKGDIYKMAPNFALVKKRLRPEWVEQWLLRPQNYLPYTKMTAFWATKDRPATAAHWPKQSDPFISPAPKGWDKVPGFEKLSGPEQVRYLRDFLFSLDADTPFPKVGEEAESPHVDPKIKMQAKDDDKAKKPPRTGAVRFPARM